MWPLQHGDGGFSAGFLLCDKKKEQFVFVETDPVQEKSEKVIPENGILQLLAEFHIKHGYFHPWSHAIKQFQETLGINVFRIADVQKLRFIETLYDNGAPLGLLHNPRRTSTIFVGSLKDGGLGLLHDNPKKRKITVLDYDEFMHEAVAASVGEKSKLSRMPQECESLVYAFRNGMTPEF